MHKVIKKSKYIYIIKFRYRYVNLWKYHIRAPSSMSEYYVSRLAEEWFSDEAYLKERAEFLFYEHIPMCLCDYVKIKSIKVSLIKMRRETRDREFLGAKLMVYDDGCKQAS